MVNSKAAIVAALLRAVWATFRRVDGAHLNQIWYAGGQYERLERWSNAEVKNAVEGHRLELQPA